MGPCAAPTPSSARPALPARALGPLAPRRALGAALGTALGVAGAMPAVAQPRAGAVRVVGLPDIGSVSDDVLRVRQTLGLDSTAGYLLRAPSLLARLGPDRSGTRGPWVGVLAPDVEAVWNSRLATGGNAGQLWAGRGASASVRAGVVLAAGRATVVLAPELTHAENRAFPIMTGRAAGRSAFSSPFHAGAASADLPLRFGDAPLTQLGLGQSSVTVATRAAAFGLSGETLWWGPGVRNALLVSDNAEGVPHAFVRTARPLRSAAGDVEARLILGGLTESIFFDTVATNGVRALSGVVATLRPRGEPGLTLGVARLVLAPVGRRRELAGHAADALLRWAAPAAGDSSRASDQLTSLFGRWVFPAAGFEVYGEWALSELPRSLSELLAAPQRSQAYTVGAAHALPLGARGALRFQLELTSLEQSRALTDRPPADDFYTSRAAPQGFTHRGRVLGAAIGPGGSSQWLAADVFLGRWQAGLFAERVRHENDALYREYLANAFRHDVSVTGGVRAAVRLPTFDVRAELAFSDRLNYLFQNGTSNVGGFRTVDVHNLRAALHVSPRARGTGQTLIRTR